MKNPTAILALFTLLGLVPGCSADDDPPEEQPAVNTAELLACDSGRLEIGGPIEGPGLNPAEGLLGERQDDYVISTTQLVVRPGDEETFGELVGPMFAELGQNDGLVAMSFAADEACGHQRTLTIWKSEDAMFAFVLGDAHARAMTQTRSISDAGRVTHWTATADEVEAMTWDTAIARMDEVTNSSIYDEP